MIKGVGTDIVKIKRIKQAIERFGDLFIARILNAQEVEIAEQKNFSESHIAGRWAAKEAVAKALGMGIGKACKFHDITIIPNSFGKPCVTLSGAAGNFAQESSIKIIELSISHESDYAVAFVVLA
ncbi:MAG: holo-ACP synthase [Lentisphaeria bacterium]